ncbi:hypothetical protein FO440_04245 [Mucilaginibacter corticis]|uniref:Uncharacterized protein n=1 Tax=Mucilaginibacter corticis TaxID=2597670 RepID=A0A556MTY6_9SPHI|nr:DUF6236 family protein [Mucilaginibacter corticis]TSJ43411.1 hypothetical protein FO440_04245 [Mucilaginibacter corticis]
MDRTLLYYPTIDIPTDNWLCSALLYTDTVSSIVPYERINDTRFTDTLKFLIDEKQYKPVFIKQLLSQYTEEFQEFERFFIDTTNSIEFERRMVRPSYISDQRYYELYNQKLTYNIQQHLKDKGFITKQTNGAIVTDEIVGTFYMGILAQYVAKTTKDALVIPSTDKKTYEDIAFQSTGQKIPAMNFILSNCLPVPVPGTSLKEIIKFKKAHRNDLIEFRKLLTVTQDKLKKSESQQDALQYQIELKEHIEKELNTLNALYHRNKIKTFLSSFESLLKLETPKLFQSLSLIGAVTTPIKPIAGLIVGSIGVSASVLSVYQEKKDEINKSECSYLFKAQNKGLIVNE